ncbi:MAG: adenylate/guanylate cyclase domain-containing protein [Gammaproteobacteria bacterium]|nr:adenylate/guanylate cyclase domain-containing protein [Pseudomonadales bacterium]MCP5347811.1 adenylate/guanylate cyclase domain-containing protein [Pseudomonadales bacterium]
MPRLLNSLAVALQMMPRGGRILILVVAALTSSLLLVSFGGSLSTLEERLGSLGWTLAPDESLEQRLTIVAIDEKSIAQVGAWPWPREEMARLTRALNQADVQLQLHDIVYSEPGAGDPELLAALEESRGAVIAQVPVLQSDQVVSVGLLTHPVSGASCQQVAAKTDSYLAPYAGFSSVPKGHITPLISSDGAVRQVPAFICVDQKLYPTLAISALLQSIDNDNWEVVLQEGRNAFGPSKTLQLASYPGLEVPLDADGNLRISFQKSPGTFQAVSAVDVMNGDVDPDLLENAWVLVGATAFGIGDIVPTPYSGVAPGVEIQARILSSLLDSSTPYTPRISSVLLGLLSFIYAGILYILAGARDRVSAYCLPLAGVLLPLLTLTLHMQLLASSNLWIGWLYPALFSILGAGLLLLLEQKRLRTDRSRVFNNLNSYLPSDVAREIAFSLPSSSINARRCDVTLLSADLRNFAAFGEARPPEESAAVLHFFFTRAAEIIEKFGGRIQEFKGDGLLAVWDRQDATAARKALTAAREMQRTIDNDRLPQHPPSGLEPLALGIGIEQGPALIGSIGPANRRTHTLLGDTVTVTLRIQEMTANLAQPILIGECAARQLSDFSLESQGSYLLSGLRIPHCLFALPARDVVQRKLSETVNLKVIKGGRSQ